MSTLLSLSYQKCFLLKCFFLCLTLQITFCHAAKHTVGDKLFAVTETVCCPPDKTSAYPLGASSCNTMVWSSIDTVINTGADVPNFKLQNAILLPPGFPKPDFVYVTNINGGERELPLIVNGNKIILFEDAATANKATSYASYLTPTTYVWKGYESNGFILPTGTTIYRLVYFWSPPTPLPCRYFPGRLWNSDNTISGFSSNAVSTELKSQGLLICKRNTKCDDPTGGSISVVPKCSTPYPLGPSNPYYVLKTSTTSDTNSTGTFINLAPNAFTVSLIDSVTNIATDSNIFNITLGDLYEADSNVTACASHTWYGNTYTASGIYTHTNVGVYPSPTSSVCNVVSTLVLEINTVTAFVTAIVTPLGGSVTLTATGANSYTWMPGSLTGSPITVSPSSTTTYTVTGTSPGCVKTATKTAFVAGPTSGTAIDYTVKDFIQISPNTFRYSVYAQNTGTTPISLRGYAFGLNHQSGMGNGGTITQSFVSRDPLLSSLPQCNVAYTPSLNHLRVTTVNAPQGNEVLLNPALEYRLATIEVQTSAASFSNNFNPFTNIAPLDAIQVNTIPGKTQCIATAYVNAGTALQSLQCLYGIVNPATNYNLNVLTAIMEPSPTGPNPFVLNPLTTSISIGLFIEGYWDGVSGMLSVLANQGQANPAVDCDSITVELVNNTTPYNVLYSTRALLKIDGTANCIFDSIVASGNYYIVIKHRNAIATWSANPVSIGISGSYDFRTAATQAYGSNQSEVSSGVWALFSGDVVNDENIDLLDVGQVETDALLFSFGYFATDLTGDGNVDLLDAPIAEQNLANFIFSAHP